MFAHNGLTSQKMTTMDEYKIRALAFIEAADLIAEKDHRVDLFGSDRHSQGWNHALIEAEHKLRQYAQRILDDAEGIESD